MSKSGHSASDLKNIRLPLSKMFYLGRNNLSSSWTFTMPGGLDAMVCHEQCDYITWLFHHRLSSYLNKNSPKRKKKLLK